ncbi:MAG: O-antigen ligase family protein [Candidatus Paceibacterota bacterium]|jgi:O-antigen ligase/cytochrome c-type biogenesis protein CcmH/NrfG
MTINKWLRYFIYAGIFIVPFIPLYVSTSMFFPFITGKNFSFRIIIEIILALWAILALRDKTARPKYSWLLYSVIALVAIDGLATLFGVYPYRSFWSNYERMDGYINLLHLGAYFLVLISVFKERTKWFWLANVTLAANVYIAIYGFAQLGGLAQIHQSGTRLDASLGNSAYLAVYVLFHIFIAGYLLLSQWSKNKILSAWYLIMILADAIILYFTATRGAILGLIGGVFVACFLYVIVLLIRMIFKGVILSKREKFVMKISLTVSVILIVLVAGFQFIKSAEFIKNSQVLSRFSSISLSDGTVQSRFLIWNMSWQGFQEHPVLGWGPENYSLVFSKYYDPKMWPSEPWFDRSHNIFFDWLISAGLLGLLAYLAIYVSFLYYLWFGRRGKTDSVIDSVVGKSLLTGLLAAYFFHNIFVFDNLVSYILFFSLIAFVHFEMTKEEKGEELKVKYNYQADKNSNRSEEDNLTSSVGSVVILVVLCVVVYVANVKPINASLNLIQAIQTRTSPEQSLANFQKIFQLKTFGSGEALEQFVDRTVNVLNNPQAPDKLKGQYVSLTIEQIKNRIASFGQDTRSYLYFGSFLSMIGDQKQALAYLQKAQQLSPKKQQVLFQLVSVYVREGDATNAVKTAKFAYELDPSYPEARKIYALVCLMTNQIDLAKELLAPIKQTSDYFADDRFLQAFEKLGEQKEVQDIKNLRAAASKK